jgi:guanine nucleotide-binding protein alpha-1 subunit
MPSRAPLDPLAAALQPPSNESQQEKTKRLADEAEARRISHEIDEELKRERAVRKKKHIVSLLLLGQSESGTCRRPHCALRNTPLRTSANGRR